MPFAASKLSLAFCLLAVGWLVGAALEAAGQDGVETKLQRAAEAQQRGEHTRAIEVLSEVISASPQTAIAWYLRGRARFCAGQVAESVADFHRYVELKPTADVSLWERGIAYYYAGKYAEGAKQFERYQTYHNQDVENAVWRYLCVARAEGIEQARATLLPITSDPRVPMMQIYDLFRGQAEPADVLAAAEEATAAETRNVRLFYAHLYVGLWHESAKNAEEARKHLFAAESHKIAHYMWDVAHVHAERLRAAGREPGAK